MTVKETSQNRIVKVSALTQVADAYHDAGEYEKALDVYDDILQDYADEGPYIDYVQYRQAITLLRLNRLEAAALSFQTLEANFPGSEYVSDARYYLGLAYYKKGDWGAARKYILEYLSGYPRAALTGEAQYILGVSQLNLNEYAGALKTFNDFLEKHSEDASFVPNVEFKIAKCYEGLGQKEEMLRRLKVIYHKYPDLDVSREALQVMGDVYAQMGQTQKAVQTYLDFLAAFSGHPSASAVYYNLGQIYVTHKEYDKAVEMLKNVKPDADGELYGKARLLIVDIFSEELDSASALGTCQNIVENSPEFRRDAYAKMGELYKVRFDYAQALDAYQKALASAQGMSHIENAEIQFWIADTYELMNRKDRAVEEYLKIPYLYPQHTAWVVKSSLRAARIFEDQSRRDEAAAIYRKIVEMKVDESKFAQERLDAMSSRR